MKNYCLKPTRVSPTVFYRCGFEIMNPRKSPIGKCRYAVPCCIFPSRCTHYAMGACFSDTARKELEERNESVRDTIGNTDA